MCHTNRWVSERQFSPICHFSAMGHFFTTSTYDKIKQRDRKTFLLRQNFLNLVSKKLSKKYCDENTNIIKLLVKKVRKNSKQLTYPKINYQKTLARVLTIALCVTFTRRVTFTRWVILARKVSFAKYHQRDGSLFHGVTLI